MKKLNVILIVGLFSMVSYGMEDKQELEPKRLAAVLKRNSMGFERSLDGLLDENNNPGQVIRPIKENATDLSRGFSLLTNRIQTEVVHRDEQRMSAQAHTEMKAFLALLKNRISTTQNSDFVKQLQGLQSPMQPEDRDVAVAELYESQIKTLELIENFFGLVANCPTAYKLVERDPLVVQDLLQSLWNDRDSLKRLGEACYNRWYGQDGFGQKFSQQIDEELESLEKLLFINYEKALQKRDGLKQINTEIKRQKFEQFKKGSQKKVIVTDSIYNEKEVDPETVLKQLEEDKIKLELQRDQLYQTQDQNLGSNGNMPSKQNNEKESKGKEKEKDSKEQAGQSRKNNIILPNRQNLQPVPFVPNNHDDVIKTIISNVSKVPQLFKKVLPLVVIHQCFDDLLSQLVSASENSDVILSDLAKRLKVGDGEKEVPMDKVIKVMDDTHKGLLKGSDFDTIVSDIPEILENTRDTIDLAATTVDNIGWGLDTNTGWGTGYLKSFFVKPERAQAIRENAFKIHELENKLKTNVIPMVNAVIDRIMRNIDNQQPALIKLDALKTVLRMYSHQDSRTRNLGDQNNQFRRFVDDLGQGWQETKVEINQQDDGLRPTTSDEEQPLRRKNTQNNVENQPQTNQSGPTTSTTTTSQSTTHDEEDQPLQRKNTQIKVENQPQTTQSGPSTTTTTTTSQSTTVTNEQYNSSDSEEDEPQIINRREKKQSKSEPDVKQKQKEKEIEEDKKNK